MDNRKPILVTGSSGMVGSSFCDPRFVLVTSTDFDIRDRTKVHAFITKQSFSAVFHLAAMTDLEQCEAEPDLAYEVNTLGAHHVAQACALSQVPLIHISTSGVFGDNDKKIFFEDDTPLPQTAYARSKFMAEVYVQRACPKALILRLPWIFGGHEKDKKFVGKMLRLMQNQKNLNVVNDTQGSLLYTHDLVSQASPLWALIRKKQQGLVHLANAGHASRFDIASFMAKALNFKDLTLTAVSSDSRNGLAAQVKRPTCEVLGSKLLQPLRPWTSALHDYLCAHARESHS